MESGVELPVVQHLLGHSSLRTTALYLHVTARRLAEVRSPLDLIAGRSPRAEGGHPAAWRHRVTGQRAMPNPGGSGGGTRASLAWRPLLRQHPSRVWRLQ
jgi:hypothetical protein